MTKISPLIVLIITLGLIATFIIFTNVDLGVTIIAVVALSPGLSRQVGPVIVPLVDIVMIVTMIPWALKVMMYRQRVRFPSLNKATAILLGAMILSVFVSGDKAGSIKEILQYIIFAYMYTTMLFNNVNSVEIVDRMMRILTMGTAIIGGYAFIRFLQVGQAGLYILGMHKNALGGLMVLPIPFLLMKYISSGKKYWIFFIVMNMAGLIVSLSRGAWVGGFVGCMFVLFMYGKKELMKYLSVFIIILAIAYVIIPKDYIEIATSTHTLSERSVYWEAARAGFMAKPILGWGYANFIEVSMIYSADYPEFLRARDPHNVYLRFAAEMGIVGIAAFTFLILFIFNKIIRSIKNSDNKIKKNLIIGLMGSIAAYFTHGFFDVFWVRGTGSLFWIFTSLIFVLIEREDLIIEKEV